MIKLKEKTKLETKAILNNGQEFDVFVSPSDCEYNKDHPKVTIQNFENQSYMVGCLLIYYKNGSLDNGLYIDGNLRCVNIVSILKELKKLLKFNYSIS